MSVVNSKLRGPFGRASFSIVTVVAAASCAWATARASAETPGVKAQAITAASVARESVRFLAFIPSHLPGVPRGRSRELPGERTAGRPGTEKSRDAARAVERSAARQALRTL